MSATVPDFSRDANAYVDALLALLEECPARLMIPAHDGSIEALRARRTEVESRVALPLASEQALDIVVSKERTLALAAELGIGVPRSIPLNDLADVSAAMREVGFPAIIKPVQSWVQRDGLGWRHLTHVVHTMDQAKRRLELMMEEGGRALAQPWLPGRREAVSLFYTGERFWARFAQVSHREWPALGGVSVLCESIPLLPDITAAAERLVRAVNLEGCSVVEFRRDREGRPVLMEVNPRIAASVALAISAGVNFPKLTLSWKLGGRLEEVTTYRVGRRLRWLTGDILSLKYAFDNQGEADVPSRAGATARFLTDFLSPANAWDVFEGRDMRPVLAEMNNVLLRRAWNRLRRSSPIRWPTRVGKAR